MSFTFIVNSFAIDATTDVNIEKINDTEVNVSWAPVENAYMYYVSYGTNSIVDAEYDNVTDYIDGTGVTISGLGTGTTNYFSVTTLDESGNESELSTEVSIDLAANVFALKSVNVIDSTSIELVFSEALDNTDGTEREFNIYNKADKLDSVGVIGSELNTEDPTRLKLELDTELQSGIDYEVVVIAIKNSKLENIESGIDSIEVFTYNSIDENANETTSSTGEEDIVNSVIITESGTVSTDDTTITSDSVSGSTDDMMYNVSDDSTIVKDGDTTIEVGNDSDNTSSDSDNTSSEESTSTELNSASSSNGPAGMDIESSSDQLGLNSAGSLNSAKELPKTGPESILIFILAIILTGLVFIFKFKQS